MLLRRLPQAALACLAALAVWATVSVAQAQVVITPTVSGITRTAPRRTDPLTALWISRSDCLANDVMTFPLVVSGFVGTLEVWASNGADCRPPEARNSSVAQCWKVFSGSATNSTVLSIPIRVQDIAAMQKPPMYPMSIGTAASCDPPVGTASAAQPITLFFMAILGDQNQGGSSWDTKLDLVGPSPPSGFTVGTGNTSLVANWTATGDIDVAGYNFFCAPMNDAGTAATPANGFGAGSGDAGASTTTTTTCADAGDDGASGDASDDACTTSSTPAPASTTDASTSDASTSDVATGTFTTSCGGVSPFATGVPPSNDALNFVCGSVAGALATSVTLTGLTNGVTYAVAVGATDAVGNVGPLAPATCGTPGPTIGFPENYRAAGGTAGGGFCAMGRLSGRSRVSGAAMSVLGIGLWLARRRSTCRGRRKAPG